MMRSITLFTLIFIAKSAIAEPVEIGTVGKTYPLQEEYQINQYVEKAIHQQSRQQTNLPSEQDYAKISPFPLQTKMQLGNYEFSKIVPSIEMPTFIVGTDTVSREWLVKHKDYLTSLNARGLIVQANSFLEIEEISKIVPKLQVAMANGDGISEHYDVHRYPILLLKEATK